MFLLAKILLFVLGYLFRQWARRRESIGEERTTNGTTWYFHEVTGKKKQTRHYRISVKFASRAWFTLAPETAFDRFCKNFGLVDEFQSGDLQFDQRVYIASDHEDFLRILGGSVQARQLALDLLNFGVRRISGDGSYLTAIIYEPMRAVEIAEKLASLRGKLQSLGSLSDRQKLEPVVYRIYTIEALTAALLGYAIAVFFEVIASTYFYLDQYKIGLYTAGAGIAIGVVLLILIKMFIGRSSRTHRVMLETAFILLFAGPALGFDLLDYVNRRLDRSVLKETALTVSNKYEAKRRSRRSRKTSYYLELQPLSAGSSSDAANTPSPLPNKLKVPLAIYQQAEPGASLLLHWKKGRISLNWVESMSVR